MTSVRTVNAHVHPTIYPRHLMADETDYGEWSFNIAGFREVSDGVAADGDLIINSTSAHTVRVGNFSADGGGLVVRDNAMTANLQTSFSCNVTVAGTVSVGAVEGGGGNPLAYLSGTAGTDSTTACHVWYSSNADAGALLTLDAVGTLTSKGEIHVYSDARVKTDLQCIHGALDRVRALHGYTFARSDDIVQQERRYAGLLAQDVRKVLPEAVGSMPPAVKMGEGEAMLSVAYGAMSGLFVEAIKELADSVDRIERTLARQNES